MRKIFLAASVGAVALALVGCSEPASDDAGTADSEAVSETATADEGAADDGMAEEGGSDDGAPDTEGMDDGDRGNDTGRTPGATTANDTGRTE